MWGVALPDNLSRKTKYFGRPLKLALAYDLWKQGELVKPVNVPESLLTDTVYLGDFGSAIKGGTKVKLKMLSPPDIVFHAPEQFHNVDPSFASDMWSYMCLFIELYLGSLSFCPLGK